MPLNDFRKRIWKSLPRCLSITPRLQGTDSRYYFVTYKSEVVDSMHVSVVFQDRDCIFSLQMRQVDSFDFQLRARIIFGFMSRSISGGRKQDERTFTATEMYFEGFDFVADVADYTSEMEKPQNTREQKCLPVSRFEHASIKCGLENRTLRLWYTKDGCRVEVSRHFE